MMNILIIDDSVVMRNIHKNMLKQKKLPDQGLFEAKDGDFALIKAKQENIDMFIVDWNMPGLNGLDFVKTVRKMDRYMKTPIIMVTSEAAKYNVMEAIKAGVTNYIVKPIKPDVLWDKIEKYIGA